MPRRRNSSDSVMYLILGVILGLFISCYLLKTDGEPTYSICGTPLCLNESSEIIKQMDPDVSPCKDFHKFVCGNAWKNSYGRHSNLDAFKDEMNRQVRDLCEQPIRENEHIVLKTATNLFQKCMMNEPHEDYFKSVLNVLTDAVGGWPLLSDSKWDETKFNWLEATYKLRELGFPNSIFFHLSVAVDPRNENDYIFKISLPKIVKFEQEVVMQVAALLGANRNKIYSDVEGIQKFVEEMSSDDDTQTEQIGAIDDYHFNTVDWRQFINTIAGPAIQMPQHDMAILPQPQKLVDRLNVLASTSKRTQANYMIWKVLEEMADIKEPKFLRELRSKYSGGSYVYTTPEEDCLNLINRRFPTNPIAVMYARRYIPVARSEMANGLAINIKEEFLKLLEEADWMDEIDRVNAVERVNTMEIIVGAPEAYHDDKILDAMNADLKETTADSLLSLILQVNKNHQTRIYKQISSSVGEESAFDKLDRSILGVPHYSYANNMINLPLGYLQSFVFNDERPNYLNYGSLGAIIGSQFAYMFGKSTTGFPNTNDDNLWTDKTKEAIANQRTCLATQAKENINFDDIGYLDYIILRQSLGVKLSYSAYKKWATDKNPEEMLVGVDYTPNQLFWISSGHMLCRKVQERAGIFASWIETKTVSHFVSSLAMNNWNFAMDFNCAIRSNINPAQKCDIF